MFYYDSLGKSDFSEAEKEEARGVGPTYSSVYIYIRQTILALMSCVHPASALHTDRERGITICTLCNDVMAHQVFELDPHFSRAAPTRSSHTFRPNRTFGSAITTRPRPSLDVARQAMSSIARMTEISDDVVEMALGIYKIAATVGVITGTRSSVLCACLYAICRRERTSHVIYDFSHACSVSPAAILSQMRVICEATHTEVPVVDPSCMVQRFAELLDLGPQTSHVMICALKLLRAMKEDWIACGRRPMGVCAAALIAACCLLGIPRSPDEICGMVRLTAATITKRLTEFSATPTAQLTSIDDYEPTSSTLPPAFTEASKIGIEEDMNAEQREMASMYFQLVGEAKMSAPATAQRCERWRYFISEHCRLMSIEVTETDLDLTRLSPQQQLVVLGLPHTKPLTPDEVEEHVRKEEQRIICKQEEMQQPEREGSSLPMYNGDMGGTSMPNFDDPTQMSLLVSQYKSAKRTVECEELQQDYDFALDGEDGGVSQKSHSVAPSQASSSALSPQFLSSGSLVSAFCSQNPAVPQDDGEEATREVLTSALLDKERRYALPWEFVLLPDGDKDDVEDLLPYIILDNEERIRRYKLGEAMYRDRWERGRARTEEELDEWAVKSKPKRARHRFGEVGQRCALERALRSCGASSIAASQLSELMPGMAEDDDVGLNDFI